MLSDLPPNSTTPVRMTAKARSGLLRRPLGKGSRQFLKAGRTRAEMAMISLAHARSRSAPVVSVVLIGAWLAICTLIFFRIETTSFEHRSVLASIFMAVCLVFIFFFVLHSTYCFAVGAACLLRRGRLKANLGPSKE